MEREEVIKIYEEYKEEYSKSESENPFLEGLIILDNLSTGPQEYAAEHDIFYADGLENLPDITKEDVIKLNKLGWHFDSEFDCFANFT